MPGKNTYPLLLFLLFSLATSAQTLREVRGSVRDSLGVALPGAHVALRTNQDTVSTGTGKDGSFVFGQVSSAAFRLEINHIGYQTQVLEFSFSENQPRIMLDPILLKGQSTLLKEITIRAIKPIEIKEDTVQYNAEAFPVREGSLLEELMKKLPGLTVDRDGNIETQGKKIGRVRVNGKDFFSGEVQTATRNLPADAIENVQVINDYGEQASRTGIKTGEPEKILNVTLKENRNRGLFGQAVAGAGSRGRFLASGSANLFEGDRQLAVHGVLNNTNSNPSPSGSTGAGQRANSPSAGGAGIMTTGTAGINYRHSWSSKVSGFGSYDYSGSRSEVLSNSIRQSFLQDEVLLNEQRNDSKSSNMGHQVNYNLEYRPNLNSFFRFSPRLFYNKSGAESSNVFLIAREAATYRAVTSGNTNTGSRSMAPNAGADVFLSHALPKQGRVVTLDGGLSYNRNQQEQFIETASSTLLNNTATQDYIKQRADSENPITDAHVNVSFTEPLSAASSLQFAYSLNGSATASNRQSWEVDPENGQETAIDSLSDRYRYRFLTQRIGLSYQLTKQKYNFTLGLFAQPVKLHGTSATRDQPIVKQTFNVIPDARFFYSLAQGKTLQLHYNVFASQPSFTQLQPVTDLSNPQYPITGNPDLKPEIAHSVNLSYNQFDMKTNSTFFTNVAVTQTQDKIVPNVIRHPGGRGSQGIVQETSYLNTGGFYSANASYSYSRPFAERKITAAASGTFHYSNNVSFIDYERISGATWGLNQGLSLRLDLPDVLDAVLSGNYSLYRADFAAEGFLDNTTHSVVVGLSGQNFLTKQLTFGYSFNKILNSGFVGSAQVNPAILDAYTEYRFLKNRNAAVRLQGFDLFNQNVGVLRNVSGNSITDTRTSLLSRYFLLTLSFRLQKV